MSSNLTPSAKRTKYRSDPSTLLCMSDELLKINQKLIEILSQESGYFGRVDTWGQMSTKYEYIGYELDTEFSLTLQTRSGFIHEAGVHSIGLEWGYS